MYKAPLSSTRAAKAAIKIFPKKKKLCDNILHHSLAILRKPMANLSRPDDIFVKRCLSAPKHFFSPNGLSNNPKTINK